MLSTLYKQTVLPIVNYCCIVWGDFVKQNAVHLERLQNQAMQIILRANRKTCAHFVRSLSSRRRFTSLQLVLNPMNNIDCPRQLKGYLVKRSELHDRNFRDSSQIDSVRAKSTMGQ